MLLGIAAITLSCCLATSNLCEARHHRDTQPDLSARVVQPTGLAAKGANDTSLKSRVQSILQAYQKEEEERSQRTFSNKSANLKQLPMDSKDEGGTLLFSDSPEYVPTEGILYRDTVEGNARVLYYHLNNTSKAMKVAVVVENMYDGLNRVRVTRGGAGHPSDDYLKVGKEAQLQYFGSEMNHIISMPRNDARLLVEDMNNIIMQPGQLVYGCYDFTADHPVKVSVLMLDAYGDPVNASRSLPVLPKDEMRLRGTFTQMNRVLTPSQPYDPAQGNSVYFPLADNITDRYRDGIDATDGSRVTNFGNYGILYRIKIPATATKTPIQYYLSPLGGVYAGAMRVYHGDMTDELATPANQRYFGDATPPESSIVETAREHGTWSMNDVTEISNLGVYDSDEETIFEFSPPGASNLPVNIIMQPKK